MSGAATVHKSGWHWGGWHDIYLLHLPLTHPTSLGALWKSCFWFLQCLQDSPCFQETVWSTQRWTTAFTILDSGPLTTVSEDTRSTLEDLSFHSLLRWPLDEVEVVGNMRMKAKLSSLMDNMSHHMQDTQTAPDTSVQLRLLRLII